LRREHKGSFWTEDFDLGKRKTIFVCHTGKRKTIFHVASNCDDCHIISVSPGAIENLS
jgi:hypothetical protein